MRTWIVVGLPLLSAWLVMAHPSVGAVAVAVAVALFMAYRLWRHRDVPFYGAMLSLVVVLVALQEHLWQPHHVPHTDFDSAFAQWWLESFLGAVKSAPPGGGARRAVALYLILVALGLGLVRRVSRRPRPPRR